VEIKQLLGEYDCKLDAKGRMRLPSGLISKLGEEEKHKFVINRGFEKCLMLYPEAIWNKISGEVDQLNLYNKKNRDFVRYFYRGATELQMDAADRILLPKRLLEYAGIEKEVVLSAYNGRIEIWTKEEYDSLLDDEPVDFSDLANEVLGEGSNEDVE
jgi:MraZ protein